MNDDAFPDGTRIRKVNAEAGDFRPNGSLGTVVGVISLTEQQAREAMANIQTDVPFCRHFYFVVWDARPDVPVGIMGGKVELACEPSRST